MDQFPPNTTSIISTTGTGVSRGNITAIRQSMSDLYGAFGIQLAKFPLLDPLQLQPLSLVQSTNATTQSLAVALLAADIEMGALAALGAALLTVASGNSGAATPTSSTTLFAQAVAAEGARKLIHLQIEREALLAELQAWNSTAAPTAEPPISVTDTNIPNPPSPSLPLAPPSPGAVGGLYTADVIVSILSAAAARTNVNIASYAINATAEVIAGMAAFAEMVMDAALMEVGGVRVGLNPLNALITLSRLSVVQVSWVAVS